MQLPISPFHLYTLDSLWQQATSTKTVQSSRIEGPLAVISFLAVLCEVLAASMGHRLHIPLPPFALCRLLGMLSLLGRKLAAVH